MAIRPFSFKRIRVRTGPLALHIAKQPRGSRRCPLTRSGLVLLGAGGMILVSAERGVAQAPAAAPSRWEFRVPGGAFVPTGAQRHDLKDGRLTAAQVAWVARPRLALAGTIGWARSRDLATAGAPRVEVFLADVGVEARSGERALGRGTTLRVLAGLGAGARSYNHRKPGVDATHNLAGYGSAGGEVDAGRLALRLEARNYATGFKPLLGSGRSELRNDVVIMAALRLGTRAGPRQGESRRQERGVAKSLLALNRGTSVR
jgi:hypothetical protein